MSPISIGFGSGSRGPRAAEWSRFGLLDNPFPPSGVPTDVDYEEHQAAQIDLVNRWLRTNAAPTATQWGPLVLKGSIGVGKTHILKRIEREVNNEASAGATSDESLRVGATYQTLTSAGSRELLLGSLLREVLRSPLPPSFPPLGAPEPEMPLVETMLEGLWALAEGDKNFRPHLPSASPLQAPVRRLLAAPEHERPARSRVLVAWLARRELSRADMTFLGVGGKIESEGESIRAFAHVCRLARQAIGLRCWFLLIDQIEDLWRKNETTPLRRARFLTDLRTLVDEALEGAPVGLVLAWNTAVSTAAQGRHENDVERQLRNEYAALWSRLPEPIDLPPLGRQHAVPFALAYVNAALDLKQPTEAGARGFRAFQAQLEAESNELFQAAVARGGLPDPNTVVERSWLEVLRTWAERQLRAQRR